MSSIHVSWSEYHQKIEILASKIYQSGWDFNQIVCIAKGGLRVGDILCRIYRKPLAIFSASSYAGSDNRTRSNITLSQHLSMTSASLGNRVLLVDDLVDSGISLKEGVFWLKENHGNEIEEIRTAVIWYKSCSKTKPDYYVDFLPDNPWIHQPFEIYEQTSPAELAQRHQIIRQE
jgi:uncharacterized protein